jgi:glycosyltransferase involved in cell wall biosynthesis
MTSPSTPKISFLVVIYRMSRQAENTLYSLSARHQKNVREEDYEIIAVENRSDDVLGEARATALGKNVRYFLRDEATQTPVFALNFAYEQSRAPLVCLIIDGARMATPRLVEHALKAQRLADHPLIAVPGYHLGPEEHHKNVTAGYDERVEAELLEQSKWKEDGYGLFDIACFSGANDKGFLSPMLESNCLLCTRECFEAIGRADERFDLPGGGSVNIHIYTKLAALPNIKFIVLGGEGSFHQFHGGVTTAEVGDREEVLESHRKQLRELNGGKFEGAHREPMLFGVIPGKAQLFLQTSAGRAAFRHTFCKKLGLDEWPLDKP